MRASPRRSTRAGSRALQAIDANILVRVLVADDPEQARRAREAVEAGGAVLLATVALEAAWVLRRTYGLGPGEVVALLRSFLGLPGVEEAQPGRLWHALDWAEAGMGFADAVHLASVPEGVAFLTFDRDLIRRARALGLDAREP